MRINRAGACALTHEQVGKKPRGLDSPERDNYQMNRVSFESGCVPEAPNTLRAGSGGIPGQAPAPIEFQLATKTRKCLTTHPQAGLPHQCAETRLDFNGKPPGNIRFVCTCALDAIVFVVGVALVFGLLVVLGAVMGAI